MNVYHVSTPYTYSQINCVVADSMAEAEKILLEEYPMTKILKIELHSEYVLFRKQGEK